MKNRVFHFSRAVLSLSSADIAGLLVPLPHEKSYIYKGDTGQTTGREKELNWRKTRISDPTCVPRAS